MPASTGEPEPAGPGDVPAATLERLAALTAGAAPSPERVRRIGERTRRDPVWRKTD